MTDTITVVDVAREAGAWFETATRDDDTTYVRTKDGAPEWIGDMCRDAHGDMFPDDWRYACIAAAVDHIAGDPEDPEEVHDFADSYVDTYTADRLRWLASHLTRVEYVDNACEELGAHGGIVEMIAAGQYVEASEVYGAVLDALTARALDLLNPS